ncbi:unnamed protein product [Mycena citricolor]|uniref:PCI domain-containing protein n=1 Tax=Mycena citricolor TaxID=2018698 RepID=A0AAD2GUX6_9AGAR|nr:unnamed protein product [Mycena citricolor]
MSLEFSTFLTQINDALNNENGPNLAYLLHPGSPHGKDLVKIFRSPSAASLSHYKGSIVSPWDDIAIQYVLTCSHIARDRRVDAFKEHSQLVSHFFRFFTENRGWTLPALFSVLRDVRDIAYEADWHARVHNQNGECLEEAARTVAKAFSNCMVDRVSPPEESRKWGVYYVAGLAMKCYFRIKHISLTKNVIKALNNTPDIPPLQRYPRSHQVTYRYYLGMLGFLNEEYVEAERELTFAFYNCVVEAQENQTRVNFYLPIDPRLLSLEQANPGIPHSSSDSSRALAIGPIRASDISAFDRAIELRKTRLIELNLLLALERARELCVRGLFRKAWIISEKTTRMPIALFHSALEVSGITVGVEEAECLVANMIYKGYMRGYISHAKQMVVLAAANAFPSVAERLYPYNPL